MQSARGLAGGRWRERGARRTSAPESASLPGCVRQGSEVVDQVLHTVSKSNSLEELTLENAGLKS